MKRPAARGPRRPACRRWRWWDKGGWRPGPRLLLARGSVPVGCGRDRKLAGDSLLRLLHRTRSRMLLVARRREASFQFVDFLLEPRKQLCEERNPLSNDTAAYKLYYKGFLF